jgi:23S rRNA G2069 N7-methylase RlmK/C1962 C5-methylase RlmI
MRKNGFVAKRYRYACSEVRSWLAAENAAHRTYDLVVCDAPAWLPAKDAGGRDWDAERDLSSLLASATRVLSSQGLIVRMHEGDEPTTPHRGYSVVRKGE